VLDVAYQLFSPPSDISALRDISAVDWAVLTVSLLVFPLWAVLELHGRAASVVGTHLVGCLSFWAHLLGLRLLNSSRLRHLTRRGCLACSLYLLSPR